MPSLRSAALLVPAVLLATAVLLPGCGDRQPAGEVSPAGTDTGFQYTFPPDLPFDPSEWTTNTSFPPLGAPEAKRELPDRPFIVPWLEFPPTLRRQGPNANTSYTNTLHTLMYDTLVELHPETEEYVPRLASHWRIETDPDTGIQTFWFRINERARWSDGSPVTAADVHATWWHRTQADRNDAMSTMTFKENFEEPEILDRLTVKVRTTERNWRLFLYFGAGMLIYPAKECHIPGDRYLDEYNWKFMTGSGPYELASPSDIKRGEGITLTRRENWWCEHEPGWGNQYNFRRVKFQVVLERELVYQMFKAGDIDWYPVARAQRWVEEVPKEEAVQNGWVQARRVSTQMPIGFSGLAFNQRKPPFDDKRVRLAVAHLFNRERLIEKLFFNQYAPINSIFPGRDWGASGV